MGSFRLSYNSLQLRNTLVIHDFTKASRQFICRFVLAFQPVTCPEIYQGDVKPLAGERGKQVFLIYILMGGVDTPVHNLLLYAIVLSQTFEVVL